MLIGARAGRRSARLVTEAPGGESVLGEGLGDLNIVPPPTAAVGLAGGKTGTDLVEMCSIFAFLITSTSTNRSLLLCYIMID